MKQEPQYEVRVGVAGCLPVRMTVAQARRWGDRNMPGDLKRAGFSTVVFKADPEIHGDVWLRVSYGK